MHKAYQTSDECKVSGELHGRGWVEGSLGTYHSSEVAFIRITTESASVPLLLVSRLRASRSWRAESGYRY